MLSISLSVSKIFEDIWNYIQNVLAFLILLYVLENNGQFIQKQINVNSLKFQQDQSLHNNEKGYVNSEKNISKKSVGMQQIQSMKPSENVIINCGQALHINQYIIEQHPNIQNSSLIGASSNRNILFSHNQNQCQNKFISEEEQNLPYDTHQNIISPRGLYSHENIFNQDQIISCEDLIQKSNHQQKELQIFNNQLNMKLVQQVQHDLSHQSRKSNERSLQKEDDINQNFTKRVSFNSDLTQRAKNNSVESQTPLSSLMPRDIQMRRREISCNSNQSIESVRINNIILKRMQSQEDIKKNNQHIQKQNKQQRHILYQNEGVQQNTKYIQNQIQNKEQENFVKTQQQYYNSQFNDEIVNKNDDYKQKQNIDEKQITQNNQTQQNYIYQVNEHNTEQNLPDTPQLNSNGCISSDEYNTQYFEQINTFYKQQNDSYKQQQSYQQKQNQMKLPSFSNLKNDCNQLQNNFDEIIQNEKNKNQNSSTSIQQNQNQQMDDTTNKIISNQIQAFKEGAQIELKNDINFKLTFNDLSKDQQTQIKNNQKQTARNSTRSYTQNNNNNNDNSESVRLKLYELEKTQSNSDTYIASNQLIKQQNEKTKSHVQLDPKLSDQYELDPPLITQTRKRQSTLQENFEDDFRRIQYEKLIYEKIECGVIILDQSISIIHKNKQIHEFFHQTELNDNLMNCLKLVTISDQSILSLKQFLLSSSKQDKNRNIQEIQEVKIQTIWGLTQINQFLNQLNNQALKEEPISLKQFLSSLFQIFSQKQLKEQVNDLTLEFLQVLFSQKNVNQFKSKDGQSNTMFMSVQFKIHFCYKPETKQYESIISLVNTRQRDISIKKEISESISHRIFQTLSHEFGTYMNIISNITENALEDDRISVELKKDYFRIINTNSLLLENVIKNMRDFFSIMNQRLEIKWDTTNLQETLFQTLELFKKQFQLKRLKVQIKIQKGVQKIVNSDGQFIKQILSNFISNSLKFTLSGQIKVFLFKHSNRYLRLEVDDSGIGMTSEECERLQGMLKNGFTDEKISKNSVGLGFGLLISNNLARMIGNPLKKQAIYFQSRPKEGSKFWILINSSINQNNQHQSGYSKMSSFSKQVHDSQVKSGNSATVKNTQRSIKIQKEKLQISNNKSNLTKSKSFSYNKKIPTIQIHSNSKPQVEIKKNKKSSPQLERVRSHSNVKEKEEKQNIQNMQENEISKKSITTNKNRSSLKNEFENSNSLIESKPQQRSSLNNNQLQIKYDQEQQHIQKLMDMLLPKTVTQMFNDISQQTITINEVNESGQYLQKLIRQPIEKNLQKKFSKRNSMNVSNFNINSQFVSPNKQNIKNSINLFGLGTNKREPQTPSQGISMESSQMISSRIFQIRSRAKHTIMNKQSQTGQQNNYLQLSNANEQTENVSIQSIDGNNKANLQISKLPQSTFDTPNYLTMSTKNGRSVTGTSYQVLATPLDSRENLTIGQTPLKPIKETLTYISQSNHINVGSVISSHSNNQNSSSSNNQNPKTITNPSMISPNSFEQTNKTQIQNNKERPANRCSLEQNLIPNHSQLITKFSSINSFACIVSNPLTENNNNQQQTYSNTLQGKSSKYIEQRIVEEMVEDDTKVNQNSDNYSSNINENFTNPSSCSMTPRSNKNNSFAQKQKYSKGVSIAEKFISDRKNSFQQQGQNQLSTPYMRKSSNSTSTKKKNSDDSDCSQNTLSNHSVSIEYVVQRDTIEYSDFEFDENHSLDDIDQTNNNKHKTLFQQLNNQIYGSSPIKLKNLSNSQKVPNVIFKQNKQNIEQIFDEINVTPTKTMNDFKGQKSPKQSISSQKYSDDFPDRRSSAQTDIDQDEDNYKETIPSERDIQHNGSIRQYDLKQCLSSKGKSNSESRGLVQKLQNTENVSESKVVGNNSSRNNYDLSIHLPYNHQSEKVPSIAFNVKQQKYVTQTSIQDQGVFSFGVDEKLFGGDNNQQNTQGHLKNQQQTSNFMDSKINSLKNSLNLGSQRKNTLNFNQQYLQIPFQQDFYNPFLSPQMQQQQSLQQQYKLLFNDQNSHQLSQLQQQQQQNIQNRFNSQSQLRLSSNHTLSMMNIDEYDDYQAQLNNNNVYLNKTFENLQNQKKILIVDDEIFNIYSLKLIFSKFGLKDLILEAYNGQQAIEQIMNQQSLKSKRNNELGYQIGMIIMDVNMPIMNGIECTKYIRELENNQTLSYSPNIIGYTAYSDCETKEQCYEAGMDDLLLKPSRRDDFISILEKYYLNC